MKKIILSLLTLCALPGCSEQSMNAPDQAKDQSAKDQLMINFETITVKKSQEFNIELRTPSYGYWAFARLDPKLLKFFDKTSRKTPEEIANPDLLGCAVITTYRFQALKKGTTSLVMHLISINSSILNTINYTINIE
jgi:hypothetical protein